MPKEPDKDTVLSVNSTSVTLTFGSWPTQMCSIHSFTCQYAANGRGGGWVKFPRQKLIGGDTFTIGQLQPATVYTVRVVVHTEAGDTQWEHRFATRTKTGGNSDCGLPPAVATGVCPPPGGGGDSLVFHPCPKNIKKTDTVPDLFSPKKTYEFRNLVHEIPAHATER